VTQFLLCYSKYLTILKRAASLDVMTPLPLGPRSSEPQALHAHALEDLRFVRETMQRASSFTAVPGRGGVAMGVTALCAAAVASRQPTVEAWLATWLLEAALALSIGVVALRQKARAVNVPLLDGAGRKFVLSLCPPLASGALLSVALYRGDLAGLLPGTWLLLYGAGIVTAGAFSVKIVPVMGLCFMLAGALALLAPADAGDWFMAGGFGGLQVLFGILIARRHGG
jgi:hypothetical protein